MSLISQLCYQSNAVKQTMLVLSCQSAVAVLYCSPSLLSRKCRAVAMNAITMNTYVHLVSLGTLNSSDHVILKIIFTRSKTAMFLGPLLQFSFFFPYLYIGIYYNVSKYTLDHLIELLKGIFQPLPFQLCRYSGVLIF